MRENKQLWRKRRGWMDEGEKRLTDWRSLSWAGKGLQGDGESPKGQVVGVVWVVWSCVGFRMS